MLDRRVRVELGDTHTVYEQGSWSVSYFAMGQSLSLSDLKKVLESTHGHETGWPPWWVPTREAIRPRVREDGIECWLKTTR